MRKALLEFSPLDLMLGKIHRLGDTHVDDTNHPQLMDAQFVQRVHTASRWYSKIAGDTYCLLSSSRSLGDSSPCSLRFRWT